MGKTLNNIFLALVAAATLPHSNSIRYNVTNVVANTTGGKLFDQEIGAQFAVQVMENATSFAWQVFNQTGPTDDKYEPEVVNLYISEYEGYAFTQGNNINISEYYLGSTYQKLGNTSKLLFTSVMYHEMTHVLQWKGNNETPSGLIEGIADYVKVKSGYYQDDWWYNRTLGSGNRWDEGYDVTEMFLEYCESLREGFVAQLNKKMRYIYNDGYFQDLLGKPVGQLWTDYKAKYGNKNGTSDQASNTRFIDKSCFECF